MDEHKHIEGVMLDCSRYSCMLFSESSREHGPDKPAKKETAAPMLVDGSSLKRSRAEVGERSRSSSECRKGNDRSQPRTTPFTDLRSVSVKDRALYMDLHYVAVKENAHLKALHSVLIKDDEPHRALFSVLVKDPPNFNTLPCSTDVIESWNAGPTAKTVSTTSTIHHSSNHTAERVSNLPSCSYSTVAPAQPSFLHEK